MSSRTELLELKELQVKPNKKVWVALKKESKNEAMIDTKESIFGILRMAHNWQYLHGYFYA
jgi:hypothetical protein